MANKTTGGIVLKPETQQRIRDLSKQHPSWTPSQLAIFLQGENLKITSEDVRRTLAKRDTDEEGENEGRPSKRYAAPRERVRRSALPVGLLFGPLTFVVTALVLVFATVLGSYTAPAYLAVYILLVIVSGAVGSRVRASGARAGLFTALIHAILMVAIAVILYNSAHDQLESRLGHQLPNVTDQSFLINIGIDTAIALVVALIIGLILGWIGATLFGRRERRATFGSR